MSKTPIAVSQEIAFQIVDAMEVNLHFVRNTLTFYGGSHAEHGYIIVIIGPFDESVILPIADR